ncbi:hypothetical protein HDV06_006425 [Boothiomyces sp. JEL0866]|nr:hypothetical protein HDV06_006425 [Boothiomyces sp. JEL0866]
MSKTNLYSTFLKQVGKIAHLGPEPPKCYNLHKMITSPVQTSAPQNPFHILNKTKSEAFQYQGIPVPNVIKRHVFQPLKYMENETSIGRIQGFCIQVKGRNGARSMKREYRYGSIDAGNVAKLGGTMVDFGKSSFTTKRGVTGVKVWVAYGK